MTYIFLSDLPSLSAVRHEFIKFGDPVSGFDFDHDFGIGLGRPAGWEKGVSPRTPRDQRPTSQLIVWFI